MGRDEAEQVHAAIVAITGHAARFSHFPLVGVCESCRSEDGIAPA
jgi:hypothetical protein